VHLTAPVSVQVGICVELALEPFESIAAEDFPLLAKKSLETLDQRVSVPVHLHAENSHINLTVLFSIHFPMDVHMQDRLLLVHQGPALQTLMKGILSELLLHHVVGVDILVADEVGGAPEEKGLLACVFG
jgi:hypothetical protein